MSLLSAIREAVVQQKKPDVRLDVRIDDHCIVLSGEMVGTTEQSTALDQMLRRMAKLGGAWEVDANEIRLAPEGATMWIHGVRDRLHDCVLTYRPSHLAVVLQYDPRYSHPQSTFVEYTAE